MGSSSEAAGSIFRADGCPHCLETGYRGRNGIFEFLQLSEAIKGRLSRHPMRIRSARGGAEELASLRQDGIHRVMAGETTMSEVVRVTQL